MHREWKTPAGQVYTLYRDMLNQPHLLIAGATGSGKSVVINGLVYTALHDSPAAVQFILIDPKRVELVDYRPLPHTLQYSSEPGEMVQAFSRCKLLSTIKMIAASSSISLTMTGTVSKPASCAA